jgi:hypothetical protein
MFDIAQNPRGRTYTVRGPIRAVTETAVMAPSTAFMDRNAESRVSQEAFIDGTIPALGTNLARGINDEKFIW